MADLWLWVAGFLILSHRVIYSTEVVIYLYNNNMMRNRKVFFNFEDLLFLSRASVFYGTT